MKYIYLSICLTLAMLGAGMDAAAQTGTIRGKVIDGGNGEPLLGATIRLMDEGAVKGGAYTDLEGAFTIKAAPGTYSLLTSYISYITDTTEITVVAGEIGTVQTLMYEESTVREDLAVTITAKTSAASDVAFLAKKQSSINSIDGVTFDLVQRTGDANAAAAVQRVVGVSVEGGKYVYVRGLGDRYSQTMLNGAAIPGLDPNRNTVQMDIFPSNLIDNIIVYKNFTPDLPGSLTGGLINVQTKDFPDRFTMRLAGSVGFNSQASLNDDFLGDQLYDGDALGIGNEIRDLPTVLEDPEVSLPRRFPATADQLQAQGPILEEATRSFETSFLPTRRSAGLNQNYGLSFGNQHQVLGRPFGYIASLSYRRTFTYYENGQRNFWQLPSATSEILDPIFNYQGDRGEDEMLWGGLVKLSYKPFDRHKISFNYLRNQSGNNYGETFEGPLFSSGGDIILQTRTTGYIERGLTVYQLQGEHAFGSALEADWIVSSSNAYQEEPDLRFFANEVDTAGGNSNFIIQAGNGYDLPLRFFRDLTEENLDARLNLRLKMPGINSGDKKGAIKFGGAYTSKQRTFSEQRYAVRQGRDATPFAGDVEAYLADSNLVDFPRDDEGQINIPERFEGVFYVDNSVSTNAFDADQTIFAGYAMAELPIGNRLNLIFGARYEGTRALISLEDTTVLEALRQQDTTRNPGELDLDDVLPAFSLIYNLSDDMKLRAGYTRTLARPTVLELSPFEQLIGIGQPVRIGNPFLQRSLIDNVDVRWEWFFSITEFVSVSGFYKNFTDPIELAQDFTTQNPRFQYINRDSAFLYGAEIEFRKNFGFISPSLEKLQFSGNASFVYSQAAFTEEELRNIQAVDPERSTVRPLYGQSPYVLNGELAYVDKDDLGLQASLSLNVFGPRIVIAGGTAPDIFEQPRPALNFSISKEIGKYLNVRFRANNLLNPEYLQTQSFKGQDFVFESYRIGRTYSLGLSFRLNN